METETTKEALLEALLAEYDVEKARAEADLEALLAKMSAAGILED